ncbi:MAG: class I SAM-dependent RNA methyltransferase [Acidobacteriota bacterium]|nr:class I SAM-dependent RNA methyltransferase [Acidobacteriota bacterium]
MSLAEPQKSTLEVEIERLLPGGVGLAHGEGLTLFVSLAAPGDVLRVGLDRIQGNVGFASIIEILKPSPHRIEPPCPYFGRCGGCDFQQLTYEAQLNAKVEIIRDCLHRIAKIDIPLDIPINPSPNQWHYRARAMWQVDSSDKLVGYFERGSNRVCDVEYCAVLVPELQTTLERVRNEIRAETAAERLRDIEVVAGDEGVSVAPPLAGFNTDIVSRVIGNETYYFSAEAFFQVNHELLVPLIGEAIRNSYGEENAPKGDAAGEANSETRAEARGETAIDLYCGVGLFTLPLARRFERVIGVEGRARATEFARRNLEFAKLNNAEVVTSPVSDWMKQHARSFGPVDFLLLDPPRAGAENAVIAGILALRPAQIAYVSCDPATLARDLKKLIAGGYALDSVAAFDMFPQTHHVETLAHLRNDDPSS